jgi:hypothetical protein
MPLSFTSVCSNEVANLAPQRPASQHVTLLRHQLRQRHEFRQYPCQVQIRWFPIPAKPQGKAVEKHDFDLAPRRHCKLNQIKLPGIAAIFADLIGPDRFPFLLVRQIHKDQLVKSPHPQKFGRELEDTVALDIDHAVCYEIGNGNRL